MRRCRCEVQGMLALAVVPVIAIATSHSPAQAADESAEPVVTLASLGNVQVTAVNTQRSITALPLQSPPVNGFQPFVVFGLTDENENDFFSFPSDMPGGTPVPNPARYFIGTLDSGSSTHIISDADAQIINLFAAGLEGPNTVDLVGASGAEIAFISDALGFYITGLGNATAGVNGPVVAPSSLKGMTNAPILTADTGSILPNIIGAPMFANYQVAILNSQTQRLTVNAQTYQGPHVELRAPNAAVGGDFTRATLELTGPPADGGGSTGAIGPAIFSPDFFGQSNWYNDPLSPVIWNSMYATVTLDHVAANSTTQQLLFDTGAQVSVVSKAVANSLGISTNPGEETPPDFTVEVLGVGGISEVPGYFIESLAINTDLGVDTVWTNVPVLVINLPDPRDNQGFVPGILGMNLFTDRDLIINASLEDPFFAFSEDVITPMWTATGGGTWGDNANWILGVPDVPEKRANFTSATPAPQTVTVEADYLLGHMSFDNPNSYTINGPGRLTFQVLAGASLIDVAGGSHTINAPVTFANDITLRVIPAASTLTISNDVTSANADITKTGDGNVAMKNVRAQSLTINAGKVTVLPNGSAGGVSSVGALSIASGGTLDVKDNDLVVRGGSLGTWDGGSNAYTGITGLIDAGRGDAGNAQWNGSGIVTSDTRAVNNNNFTSLGIATGAQALGLEGTDTATWSGQTVAADDVLVMFTYGGDATLDGKINIDDYGRIDGNVAQSGSVFGWFNGDFNYDGKINIDDYGIIDGNINQQGAPLSSAPLADVTAVPEPASIGLLAACSLLLHRRRRCP